MIFHPKRTKQKEGGFLAFDGLHVTAHPCLNKSVFKELWHNFTLGASELTVTECREYIFSLGNAKRLPLDGYDYSINIETHGIFVCAKSEQTLIEGFMTVLDRFRAVDIGDRPGAWADCAEIADRASIPHRMVHFCVFPETELWELQRFLRFSAALKYTHVILEFWGTLRLDCLGELSWPCGFAKDDIRPIIAEARDLGVEIVPMFNHWGHASGSRAMHGKHVVLDQDPTLATYFSEDGWCWDIAKPKVRALLRRIRAELCELSGGGGYFHIGCDEAYGFDFTQESMDFICDFLNEICEEMRRAGRRIIVFGDMLLYRHKHYDPNNAYTCNAPSAEAEQYMLDKLDKGILIADWQYDAIRAPVETALVFKRAGFDCVLCPWDKGTAQLDACIDTVKQESLFGIIHTTWHTLSSGMPFVLRLAARSFDTDNPLPLLPSYGHTAALLRRVMPAGGDYERAGWSKNQVGFRW